MPSESAPSGHRVADLERGARPGADRRAGTTAPRRATSTASSSTRPRRGRTARRRGWRPPSRPGRRRWRRVARREQVGPSRAASAYAGSSALDGVAAHHADQAAARAPSPRAPRRSRGRAAPAASVASGRRAAATRRRPARPAPRRSPRSRRARRRCRAGPVGVDRDVGHGGEDDAAAGADGDLVAGGERAAEEQGAGHPEAASSSLRAVRSTERRCQPVSDVLPRPASGPAPRSTRPRPPAPASSSPAQPNDVSGRWGDHGRAITAGAPGQPLLDVGRARRAQAGVDAEPAQRLRLPAAGPVADPGQPDQVGVAPEDQVGAACGRRGWWCRPRRRRSRRPRPARCCGRARPRRTSPAARRARRPRRG